MASFTVGSASFCLCMVAPSPPPGRVCIDQWCACICVCRVSYTWEIAEMEQHEKEKEISQP